VYQFLEVELVVDAGLVFGWSSESQATVKTQDTRGIFEEYAFG
jgi:hypothetical protein